MGNFVNIPMEVKLHCDICNKDTNHSTERHVCGICHELSHSAKEHCVQCGSRSHKIEEHKCNRHGCSLLVDHEHPCNYCIANHETKEHVCEICKQLGHSTLDHYLKVYCHKCNVTGHSQDTPHFDCDKCGYIIIGESHQWCDQCNSCTLTSRPHFGKCQYCNHCLSKSFRHEYDYDDYDYRCTVCYKFPDDPDVHDVTMGIRIKKS